MHTTLEKAKEILLDILFPEICAACRIPLPKDARENGICDACLARAEIKTALTCPLCGARLPLGTKMCHPNAPYRLAAASGYENTVIQGLIRELKYGRRTAYARPLGAIIAAHLKNLGSDFSGYVILPIPLHPSRERERGFNQSLLISEFISDFAGIPLAPRNMLLRVRHTKAQAELPREERLTNVSGSFTVKREIEIPKKIILVDDVCTSGATMGAAVSALRAAGVKRIIAAVAAKA